MRARALAVLAALAALGLIEPASAQEKPAAGAIRKVAIVSLLPDAVEVSYVGSSGLTNTVYFGIVDWWRINDHVADQVADQLLKRQRFELVKVAYDRVALIKRARAASFSNSAIDMLRPDLRALATAHDLDAIFVFLRGDNKSVLCGGSPCVGYGDTGYGIYSIGARVGPQTRSRGDNAYIDMKLHVVSGDGSELAETAVKGYVPVAFNRSNEFSGIPATMLASWEETIKGLVTKHVPLAVTRLEVLNAAAAQPAGDPSTVPALTINTDCCPAQRTLAADIAKGYENAVTKEGLKIGGETAKLTVRNLVAGKRGNPFVAPPTGENKIEAVLEFRGNEYFVSDYSRMFGKVSDVANAVGELSLEKVRGIIDPATRKEKPPMIPRGPE
jgi:hypothetical protein